jgi:hypothetical protein
MGDCVKSFGIKAAAVAAFGLALVTVVGQGMAAAAPGNGGGTASSFAAQARQVGLTPAQAATFQREIDGVVRRTGGTQVTVNKVVKPGMTVLVPLPGERVAREYNQVGPLAVPVCRRGYFCTWDEIKYEGYQVDYYYCYDWQITDFAHNGSYYNNQTGGARARFYDDERREYAPSLPPGQGDPMYNWQMIYYINPC